MTGKTRIPRSSDALPEEGAHSSAAASGQDPASVPKAALRKRLLAWRRALDPAVKARWDAQLCDRLCELHDETGIDEIAGYMALPGEPDLSAAYAELAARGVRLYLPVVMTRDAALDFAAWTPGEAMDKDGMGMAVPRALRLGAAPQTLIIPCLGWNRALFRLGYGGGYYDRTLAAARSRPLAVGVGYSELEEAFPVEDHDIALDLLLTEREIM